jgi:KaiC/GvpD/RAD55 family RecA-like ATPase
LEYNNGNNVDDEMVLLIPFYETVEGVRYILRKRAGIDTEKYEKDGSLAIIDSFEAYSRQSNYNTYKIVTLFKLLLQKAEIFGLVSL